MRRFAALLAWDIRFAWRHGFYLIYAVVSLLYVVALRLFPDPEALARLLIFTDTSVLGALFIGAIILLEKDQGTNAPFSVVPASFAAYFWAKMLSLFTVTIAATGIIVVVGGIEIRNYGVTLLSVTVTTLLFSSLGFSVALRSSGLNSYFFRIIPVFIVGTVPIFDFFPLYERDVFFFLPTAYSLKLLAFGDAVPNTTDVVVGTALLCLCLAASVALSLKSAPFFLDWERGE